MIEVEGGDSCECRHEERRLRAKAKRCEQGALISAKGAEIRQIEPCAVRLAQRSPAESVHLERKSTMLILYFNLLFKNVITSSKAFCTIGFCQSSSNECLPSGIVISLPSTPFSFNFSANKTDCS